MRRLAYWLAQLTWGAPQTLIGVCVALACRLRRDRHATFREAHVSFWHVDAGLSLGPFMFVPESASDGLLLHEYGHTMQSLVLGPVTLAAITLPSALWFHLGRWDGPSYYSFYTEKWANSLAHAVTGGIPVGYADTGEGTSRRR